jgi:hypothetical protein
LSDPHAAFAACEELLSHGGSGLIEPLWDDAVAGRKPIRASDFSQDSVAEPDGRDFSAMVGFILGARAPAGKAGEVTPPPLTP